MPRAPKKTPATFDEIVAAKKPKVEKVAITLDVDAKKIAVFEIGSIGRNGWNQLVEDHPPTDDQQAANRAEQEARGVPPLMLSSWRWNPETFPPALVAAACIEPVLTVEQAASMFDDPKWSAHECELLYQAALNVNDPQREAVHDLLGKDFRPTRSSDGN